MNKKKILIVGLLVLFLISGISSAFADTIEGFDNYTTGAGAPTTSGWSFIGSNGCTIGTVNNAQTSANYPVGESAANWFGMAYTGSVAYSATHCYSNSQTAPFSININATGQALAINWYQTVMGQTSLHTGYASLIISVGGNTIYTVDPKSLANYTWAAVTNQVVFTTTPNTSYQVQFLLSMNSESGAYSFTLGLDSIKIIGGNPIITSANTFVEDINTGQWYNMTSIAGSTWTNQYKTSVSSSNFCNTIADSPFNSNKFIIGMGEPIPALNQQTNSCIISNLGLSDILVPQLAQVNLTTLNIPGKYSRTLIPCINPLGGTTTQNANTCNKEVMYLDNPANILNYQVTVSDLTGSYGKGQQYFIYLGHTTTIVQSGYLDSTGFAAALVPGISYLVDLVNYDKGISTSINFSPSAANVAPTISVNSIPLTNYVTFGQISYAVLWTCTTNGIRVSYTDTASATTSVSFVLINDTLSGQNIINSYYTAVNGAGASTNFTISAHNGTTYGISINATRTYLSVLQQEVFTNIPAVPIVTLPASTCSGVPSILPHGAPVLPNQVLGLNQILPDVNAWTYLFSLMVIIFSAAIFGARSAPLGTIIVTFEAGFFFLAGMFPMSPVAISTWVVLAVYSYMLYRMRRR